MTNKLALAVAIALGVLSILGIRSYVANLQDEVRISGEKTPFLVFGDDLAEGTILNQDHVKRKDFQTVAIAEALRGSEISESKLAGFIGRRLRTSVKSGQILTQDYFDITSGGPRSSPTKGLSPNDRLISIPVDEVACVAGLVRPGDFVDILTTLPVADARTRTELPVTYTLLQNVPVIATGSTTDPAGVGRGETFATVTVSVPSKDANKLAYVIAARIPFQLALRPAGAPQQGTSNPIQAPIMTADPQRDLNR